jgi:hypothetical protein
VTPTFAYLSQGRLLVKLPGQRARAVESAFAKETADRQARSRSIDGWKGRSAVWGQMGMAPPEWSQWEEAGMEGQRRIAFRSVCRGPQPTDLMYVLDLQSVSGVFKYDLAQTSERRLMHRNDFVAGDLVCHREKGTLAVSLAQADGSAHLAFSDDEGRHWNHVTGGDSVDQSPAWIPGTERKLVFQSAGVGRSGHGIRMGLAPYAIETLNLDGDGQVHRLLEDDKCDLLLPKMTADGTLHFIRRPYKPAGQPEFTFAQFCWDVLLLPFRLVLTVLHIFNFFSLMFSGQPLATSLSHGQRKAASQQQQFLMLWGHMVDTKRMLAKAPKDQTAALVPKDWQLVRRDSQGIEEVLAEGVLAYDLTSAGDVIYTTGTAVYVLKEGRPEKLWEDDLIEAVVCVE